MAELIEALKAQCLKVSHEQANAKVFHQGLGSFSLIDLISEMERGTKAGQTFAEAILVSAEIDGVSVAEYVRGGAEGDADA